LPAAVSAQKVAHGEWRKIPYKATLGARPPARFSGLAQTAPTQQRTLFFLEEGNESAGATPTFFISVAGQDPEVYSTNQAPNIITHSGAVEDWTTQNRSTEDHIFHIHQIHFQVLAINGISVSDPAIRDTMRVDHYSGAGPYPSITVRMDFRDPLLIGEFVYHCHILDHEDHGMMGVLSVLPPLVATTTALSANPATPDLNAPFTVTATVTPSAIGGPAATGYVNFAVDGNAVTYPELISHGVAVFHTSFASIGTHTVLATYPGDSTYLASDALPITFVVPAPGFTLGASTTSLAVVNNTATLSP
jgi:hypothetical protein